MNSVDVELSENSLDDIFRTNNPRNGVTIQEGSNGIPGKTVGTLKLPDSSPIVEWPLTIRFQASGKGIKLSPSTEYSIVIDVQAAERPGRATKLRLVISDDENAGVATGVSIGNRSLIWGYWNNPLSWVSDNSALQISVNGKLNPITHLAR